MDCSPPGSSVHGDSPGKDTGVGCHDLFQGILSNWGIEPWAPSLQADSLPSEPLGKPGEVFSHYFFKYICIFFLYISLSEIPTTVFHHIIWTHCTLMMFCVFFLFYFNFWLIRLINFYNPCFGYCFFLHLQSYSIIYQNFISVIITFNCRKSFYKFYLSVKLSIYSQIQYHPSIIWTYNILFLLIYL